MEVQCEYSSASLLSAWTRGMYKIQETLTSPWCLTHFGWQREDVDSASQKSLSDRIDKLKEVTRESHSQLCRAGESCPASRGKFLSRRRRQVSIRLGCKARGRYPALYLTYALDVCLAASHIVVAAFGLGMFSAFGPGVMSVVRSMTCFLRLDLVPCLLPALACALTCGLVCYLP